MDNEAYAAHKRAVQETAEALKSRLPEYLRRKGINTRRKFRCLCPDHLDNDPSMSYDPKRNRVHCFACGAGGDIFNVIGWEYGTSDRKEEFRIGCELFGLTTDEGRDLAVRQLQQQKKQEKKRKGPDKASVETRNLVYSMMKERLPLTDADREYLRKVRGLDDDRINADYFRMDPEKLGENINTLKKLAGSGKLKTVPGFYMGADGGIHFCQESGIGILIRDAGGHAHAVQVRRDTAEKGRRYTWFSSSFAKNGTSPGAAKDVLIPKACRKQLCVTEGRFKAEALAKRGYITISVQGVSTWKGLPDIIQKVRCSHEVQEVFLLFDSDVMGNPQLLKTLKEMSGAISEGCGIGPENLKSGVWKIAYGKGIDDCFLNGNGGHVRMVRTDRYFDACLQNLDALLKEFKVKNPASLKDGDRKAFKKALQQRNEDALALKEGPGEGPGRRMAG